MKYERTTAIVGDDGELLLPIPTPAKRRWIVWAVIGGVLLFVTACGIATVSLSINNYPWQHDPDYYQDRVSSEEDLTAFLPTVQVAERAAAGSACTYRQFFGSVNTVGPMGIRIYSSEPDVLPSGAKTYRNAGTYLDQQGSYSIQMEPDQPFPLHVKLYDWDGYTKGIVTNINFTGENADICSLRIDFVQGE